MQSSRILTIIFIGLMALPAVAATNKSTVKMLTPPKGNIASRNIKPVAARTLIENIRTGGSAGKRRIVIDLNRASKFRAFTIAGPARLVVDIPDAGWKIAQSRVMTSSPLKQYRSGKLNDGNMRIIFDLSSAVNIASAFSLPKSATEKDRIVIDLAPASANSFAANEKKMFGTDDNAKTADDGSAESQMPRRLTAEDTGVPLPEKKPQGSLRRDNKYVIVIDAGHGGKDEGARAASGAREKDIVLALALEVGRQLENTGRYRVIFTRDRDYYIKLRERVDISRQQRADLFVSIHADKVQRDGTRGASIYTLSGAASDVETERLAEEENNSGVVAGVDLGAESHDVANILLDLAMREKMNESNMLANYIEQSFRRENVRLLPNSHRSAGFAVLKAPDVPSVLIESGFLSNPDEAKLLGTSAFRAQFASALLGGLDAYFRKIESLQQQ